MNSIDNLGLLLGILLTSLALGVTLAWLFLKGLLGTVTRIPKLVEHKTNTTEDWI